MEWSNTKQAVLGCYCNNLGKRRGLNRAVVRQMNETEKYFDIQMAELCHCCVIDCLFRQILNGVLFAVVSLKHLYSTSLLWLYNFSYKICVEERIENKQTHTQKSQTTNQTKIRFL